MAVLTTAQRDRMKESTFGVPEKRMLPEGDLAHARKVFQLGPRAVASGSITPEELAAAERKAKERFPSIQSKKAAVREAVRRKLG